MKNTFGSDLSLTIFGESHGRAIGAVLDGMAAGVPVDEEFLAACMDKRRARGDGLSTPRVEADTVQFLSGVVNGHTTGTAIALMIENQNTRSGDYAKTADLLRPGHADYTAYAKYHGFQDARGGGHFSGRVTAALVAGGAILAIQPVLLPFLAIIFLVCLIPTGMVSLGSVTMAALYPVLTIIYGSLQGYAAGDMLVCAIGSGFMSGMVIYMHRANIQRIREGKEYRFGHHDKK